MKIAMIGHKRMPSREGGIEVVVEQLSVRMAALGHDVTVYNRRGHHIADPQYDMKSRMDCYKGVRIVTVPVIDRRGLAAASSSFFAAVRALFGGYDCIHFHAEGPAFMLCLPGMRRVHTVVTIHGLDWKRGKWGRFASWYIRKGEEMAAKYADEIIVLSSSVQDYFMETYGRKTHLIPNGIEAPEIMPAGLITEKYGLTKDSYFLFLGRIVPEKCVKELVQAFYHVKTDKKLVIAGSPSDTREYYEKIEKLASRDERVILTGFTQGRELEELYSNAYTYVLPSDLEGMPISLLEAMSYGCCCLTSDIPECLQVTEEWGLSFKKGNFKHLTHMLQKLNDDPQIAEKMCAGASEHVCSKYNWDEITKQTLEIYRH